ncbi:MAG: MFS transporter, partial [Planctomycetota bacterium]
MFHQLTMGLFAILAVVFFCITFLTTKERIQPDPSQKSSLGQDLKDLGKNIPWVILFLVTVLIFIGLSIRSATMLYYFKYCAGNENLFSPFNIVGVMCSTAMVKRYGSKNLFIGALALSAAFAGMLILVPATSVPLVFGLEALRQFAWGLTAPLLWAMMADVADFSEWKTGRRATAMVFAATVFG